MPFGLLLFIHGPTSYNNLNFFIFRRLPNLVRKHQRWHKVRFIKFMKSYEYVYYLGLLEKLSERNLCIFSPNTTLVCPFLRETKRIKGPKSSCRHSHSPTDPSLDFCFKIFYFFKSIFSRMV